MKRLLVPALLALSWPAYAQEGGRIVLPFTQALDNNGDPVSGAIWCFDQAGTTTDANVYSDKALSVNIGSFVATNSVGRLSSDIYSGVELKVTLVTGSCASPTVLSGPWDYIQPRVDFTDAIDVSAAQTWLANHTWSNTSGDALANPVLTLYRNSASPAAFDVLGKFSFLGQDTITSEEYASIQARIIDATAASEDGELRFLTVQNGVDTVVMQLRQGVIFGAASGGDQGVGTINATAIYDDGVQITAPSCATSVGQTIAANTTITVAHGLGGAPNFVSVWIQNTTPDQNYEQGDQVFLSLGVNEPTGNELNINVQRDATNYIVSIADSIKIQNETSREAEDIDVNDWELYIHGCT